MLTGPLQPLPFTVRLVQSPFALWLAQGAFCGRAVAVANNPERFPRMGHL